MTRLTFIPRSEFDRAICVEDRYERALLVADLARINSLYAIVQAGSGHVGSSFSSLDIVSWVYLEELDLLHHLADRSSIGVYFSSKGHDAPGLYALLAGLSAIDFELIHRLRRLDGLPGHPDVAVPWVEANTGSLGQGISKAKGMVEAHRRTGRDIPVFVMTGDGELQEGQIWESLQGAANRRLGEITVIVDHNKIQSDTWVADVSDLGDLEAKFRAYGWAVSRCDGHDVVGLAAAIAEVRKDPDVPGVVIADTVKGKGVSFMEGGLDDKGFYKFHSGAPTLEIYERALAELLAGITSRLAALDLDPVVTRTVPAPVRTPPHGDRLVTAYGAALCERARRDERIVALDADLVLDTGLIPFSEEFPDRFIECGIAEQDMVSQAGGLALRGLLPTVHSFACFVTPRANEQMYSNATERTKILYVGSLAGLVPGGPGHSHQMVRDISVMGSHPGLVAAEPCAEAEVAGLLDALLDDAAGPAYLRLVTPPVAVPYDYPRDHRPVIGRGLTLRPGTTAAIIAAGPVLLANAYCAAEAMASDGTELEVIELPWLNVIDPRWLDDLLGRQRAIVAIDNHVRIGGQGQMLLAAIAQAATPVPCLHLAVDGIPACGTNDEVLRAHGLDAEGIAASVSAWLGARRLR